MTETGILVLQCLDHQGIVAKITRFIFERKLNITCLDQYTTDPTNGYFFMRLEFICCEPIITFDCIRTQFADIASELQADWHIYKKSTRPKMGVLVSKSDHCLADLLYRWNTGELAVDIPFIISNHVKNKDFAAHYKIPFFLCDGADKKKNEALILDIAAESDFLVLARYMQILTSDFIARYAKDIINIHHSFLPSFVGADPYQQAYDRGVKIIGATAHYVTETLDAGPIIEQVVERVSHKDRVADLKVKGRNLEKLSLAKAIHLHIDHRVTRYKNKTVIFS